MTVVNPQAPSNSGGAAATIATPPSTTLEFLPGSNVAVLIMTAGTGITATLVVPGSEYGQARADVAHTITTNSNRFIGPLTADLADPSTGYVTITLSATTAVTFLPIACGGAN